MKAMLIVGSLVVGLGTYTAFAQNVAPPPTRVSGISLYGCPAHPQIQASWPVQCPLCQTVLPAVLPSAATRPGTTTVADRDDRHRREEARERERNEELREQARRHEELRERARRDEELRERHRYYGYTYPPYTYAYPPQGYYYYYSPNGGYYYNPSTGYYYYPNRGYYYNPNTGQYSYSDPGYYYPNNRYYYPPQ